MSDWFPGRYWDCWKGKEGWRMKRTIFWEIWSIEKDLLSPTSWLSRVYLDFLQFVRFWRGCCSSSVIQLCLTLCDSTGCSTPGFLVLHYLWVCSNPCLLSQWCHPTISSSYAPFFSCPQYFPASTSFPVNWLFTSGSQSIGASASAPVLPKNIQDWFPLGLADLISLQSKGLSRVFSSTTV